MDDAVPGDLIASLAEATYPSWVVKNGWPIHENR
jgi:hypothetical protein